MSTQITNFSLNPLPLPFPFREVLGPKQSMVFDGSPADLLAVSPTLARGFSLTELPAFAGGGTPVPTLPAYVVPQPDVLVVGNETAGDTDTVCSYLDTGDGAAFRAAVADANSRALLGIATTIVVRPGVYTFANGSLITLSTGVTVRGSGTGVTFFVLPPGGTGASPEPWRLFGLTGTYSGISDISFLITSANTASASGNMFGIIDISAACTYVKRCDVRAVGSITVANAFWSTFVKLSLAAVDLVDIDECEVFMGDATWTTSASFSFGVVGSWATATIASTAERGIPRIRRIHCHGITGANRTFFAVYMRGIVTFDLDGLQTVNCYRSVYVQQRDCASTVVGPQIRNVTARCDTNTSGSGSVEITLRSNVSGAPLVNTVVDGVRTFWPGAVGQTFYPVAITTHSSTTATFDGVIVGNVTARRGTADGTVRCEAFTSGAGTMSDVLFSHFHLPSTGGVIVLNGTAGSLVDCALLGSKMSDLTVGAIATRTRVASNRVATVYTDSSASTLNSNNSVA